MALINKLTAIADEVRELSGTSETLTLDAMASSIGEVNLEIATQSDLLDQVVVALEDKASGNGSASFPIGDGNTHIWISLVEGRTSPMLGVGVEGTVTVDWGDGTEPDVLTGTNINTVKWTPTHNYAEAGNYTITLTVDGRMLLEGDSATNADSYILHHSRSNDIRNRGYVNAVKRLEIGDSVTSIGSHAFSSCHSLSSVVIPRGVTSIGDRAFASCYSLSSVVIPNGVTSIGSYEFNSCYSLSSVVIPSSVTSISDRSFASCYSLSSVVIPNGVTSISDYTFSSCYSLSSVVIPDSVTSIGGGAFASCYSLSSVVIPNGVTSIGSSAFSNCGHVCFYDFTKHASVPALLNNNAFTGIPADCEIRVPAALYDEWIAATNWSSLASQIVAV